MRKTLMVCVALLLPVSVYAAGGSKKEESPVPDRRAEADRLYNEALQHRDKAWEYEKKADAAAREKDRETYRKSAERELKRAIKLLEGATRQNSRHYEAFSSLGYALRKTGDFKNALKAYDRSLKMKPDYAEALEYRAETYLGLKRIDDALRDYRKLVELDKDRAREFLAAASQWIAGNDTTEGPMQSFAEFIATETEKLGPPSKQNW